MIETAVYRDPRDALLARRKELLDERCRELDGLPAAAKRAYAWRVARAGAAVTALFGAAFVVLAALGEMTPRRGDAGAIGVIDALRMTWLAVMVSGALIWVIARLSLRPLVARAFRPGGSLMGDVTWLESTTALTALRERAMRVERSSVGLWLAAAAFHVPLAGSCFVSWIFTDHVPARDAVAYGVLASLGGAGALVVMAQRFARDLGRRQVVSMLHADWNDGSTALGVAIAGAAVWAVGGSVMVTAFGGVTRPFLGAGILWVILATLWVPGLFRHARRVVAAERQALGIEADVNWPRAV